MALYTSETLDEKSEESNNHKGELFLLNTTSLKNQTSPKGNYFLLIVNFEETDSHMLTPNVHPDQTRNHCSQGISSTGDDAYGYFNLFELPD